MTEAHAYAQTLGEEQSICFKISPFLNEENQGLSLLRRITQLPLKMAAQHR